MFEFRSLSVSFIAAISSFVNPLEFLLATLLVGDARSYDFL
jgi:hypothetical protein